MIGSLALLLPSFASSDLGITLQKIRTECQHIDYTPPEGDIHRSIVGTTVKFPHSSFEHPPKIKSGIAFVVNKDQGILITALHTLLPDNSVRKNDCNEIAPDPKSLTVTTDIIKQNETITASIAALKNGWDGCRDIALLHIAPELIKNAMSLDLAHRT